MNFRLAQEGLNFSEPIPRADLVTLTSSMCFMEGEEHEDYGLNDEV